MVRGRLKFFGQENIFILRTMYWGEKRISIEQPASSVFDFISLYVAKSRLAPSALVGVGLSLDPEGKEDRLVRTGCWHLRFLTGNHTCRPKNMKSHLPKVFSKIVHPLPQLHMYF